MDDGTMLRRTPRAVNSWAVSCAAAEELLRGMLETLNFSTDILLAAHLRNCREAQQTLSDSGVEHPAIFPLAAATDAVEAACHAFDPYRYSTDPEYQHLASFRSESLRLLGIAKAQSMKASRLLKGKPTEIEGSDSCTD